jgi:Uma2 family endonuclease
MATATPSRPSIAPSVPAIGDMLHEVVNGQIVEKTMGAFETEIASILAGFLAPFVRANRLGKVLIEMLFRIDPGTDLQRRPDVAFVSHARWPRDRPAPREAAWDVVPDLAVEVVSPSNSANEVIDKLHEYFQAGVQQVWLVYPRRSEIYVYEAPTRVRILGRGDELDGEALLPGFRLPVATLFGDEPQAG